MLHPKQIKRGVATSSISIQRRAYLGMFCSCQRRHFQHLDQRIPVYQRRWIQSQEFHHYWLSRWFDIFRATEPVLIHVAFPVWAWTRRAKPVTCQILQMVRFYFYNHIASCFLLHRASIYNWKFAIWVLQVSSTSRRVQALQRYHIQTFEVAGFPWINYQPHFMSDPCFGFKTVIQNGKSDTCWKRVCKREEQTKHIGDWQPYLRDTGLHCITNYFSFQRWINLGI